MQLSFQDYDFTVDVNTGFSEFNDLVKGDHRSDTLDPGNVKMSFNHVSVMITAAQQILLRLSFLQ